MYNLQTKTGGLNSLLQKRGPYLNLMCSGGCQVTRFTITTAQSGAYKYFCMSDFGWNIIMYDKEIGKIVHTFEKSEETEALVKIRLKQIIDSQMQDLPYSDENLEDYLQNK